MIVKHISNFAEKMWKGILLYNKTLKSRNTFTKTIKKLSMRKI